MRRPIIITAWVIAGCVVWLAGSLGGLRLLQRFDPDLLQSLVKAVPDVVLLGGILIVGPLVVMAQVAYLSLRGKLPGTRPVRHVPPSAFPVVQTPRSRNVGQPAAAVDRLASRPCLVYSDVGLHAASVAIKRRPLCSDKHTRGSALTS